MDNATVRKWMDMVMAEKGWTGTQWAREANLSPSTVLRILNGVIAATPKTVHSLAEAAGVPGPEGLSEMLLAKRLFIPANREIEPRNRPDATLRIPLREGDFVVLTPRQLSPESVAFIRTVFDGWVPQLATTEIVSAMGPDEGK